MISIEGFTGFFIFISGLIVGSFLNVCIVRLPQGKSIITPRSQCVHCHKTVPWYDNVPLLSYILLGGRCRFCKHRISFRYFIVELLTASLFLSFYHQYGLRIILLPYLVMLCGLIVATFVDLQHRIIPDEVSVGGMVVGLIFSLLIPELHGAMGAEHHWIYSHLLSLGKSLLGVLVGGGTIYAMGLMGELLFRKEAMGGGDVKFLAMVGAFLGWKLALLTFFLAPFFGGIYGVIEKIRIKESAIAYGPFLAMSTVISMFWGEEIIRFILRGYSF